MTYVLIALLIVIVALAALWLRSGSASRAEAERPVPAAQVPSAGWEAATPAPAASNQADWATLEGEGAVRPAVDAGLLASARAGVSQEIPDEVLEEMLLDATPQRAAQLFAGVSPDVMADLTAGQTQGVHFEGQARAEDLAALSNLGSAVDDLDIWDFGDDEEESGAKIKA
ncbi:hypothetical protein [Deinococcus sp. Marseille-Q6407]|uniref:hypothetical protein n=1 Tax=Deinococcus sp. Marseille-Q6407 TaxID=2969223 RepID=UPI0021BFBA11|nr:hypothetical protein [Deinococcus sp. Marseille-Q6407]